MEKIKFYKLKYKTKRIFLYYCNYKNFEWYCTKAKGVTIIYMHNDYSLKDKSKILHRVIRELL